MQVYQSMLVGIVPIVSYSACIRILSTGKQSCIAITEPWMRS
nr:MAG TPA: hypothetical protein [Caudoviricetes sp.]